MPSSMYNNSIPVFVRGLNNLSAILKKAEEWSANKKVDSSVIVNLRLAADMLPLSKQVQIACDIVKGYAARITDTANPFFEDSESSLLELQERVTKTIKFIEQFKADKVDNNESKKIQLKIGGNDLQFEGVDYLNFFVIPNFYFHITATYSILRHNGVELGKKDFLGSL